jgi:hypothetical protein
MPEDTPAGMEPPSEEEVAAMLGEAPEAPQAETPAEPPVPEGGPEAGTPPAETEEPPPPEGDQPEDTGEEQPPEGEEEQPRLWAGRFKSPEELEQGYGHVRALQDRTARERRELEERARQYEDAIRRLIPYAEQGYNAARGEQQTPSLEDNPAQAIQPMLAEQEARIRQEMRDNFERERTISEAQAAVQGFSRDHPDFKLGSAEDTALAEIMEDLELDIDRDGLEVAWAAFQSPGLRTVLRAMPDLATPDALPYARNIAGMPSDTSPQAGPRPTEAQRRAARTAAHVEKAGSGTQPGGPRPPKDDVVDPILEEAAKIKQSALGI